MANWVTNGGCINGIRFADEGGSPIDFIAAADTDAINQPNNKVIIVSVSIDSDDMDPIDGDFFLEWQNKTDASGWNDLAATGELKWGSTSDYANGDNTPTNRLNGTEDCTGMGVTPAATGIQREGANEINLTSIGDDDVLGNEWCIDLSGALAGKDYEFRISESGGGTGIYKTFTATVAVVAAGKLTGNTKNKDRTSNVGSIKCTAIASDGGSPPVPTGPVLATLTSDSGDGAYDIRTGIISTNKYFIIFGDATRSDASLEQTAEAV